MNQKEIIERIYDHIENDHISKAVMACLRLSRLNKDYVNSITFLRELHPDKTQMFDLFHLELQDLNDETKDRIWKLTTEQWIAIRTNEHFKLSESQKENVFIFGIGEIENEIRQMEKSIDDLTLPAGMGEYDTAAFTDRYNDQKLHIRLRIRALSSIRERIKTLCLNYAITIEKQIEAQSQTEIFFISAQNEVNNYFKFSSPDIFNKLQKASQLISSKEPEDFSLLLTAIRRTICAVADHFYPPLKGLQKCFDGEERELGESQYLNRLQEYINSNFAASKSDSLLKAELDHFAIFSRRLSDLASKGVHSNVTLIETKQCFLGLYMFLFNLVNKIQAKPS